MLLSLKTGKSSWKKLAGSHRVLRYSIRAGLTDCEKDSEEETARRELLEETGYLAKVLIPIMVAPLCPALMTTEANHFFAPAVESVGKEQKDSTEIIEVLKIPVEELDEFLMNLPEDTKLDLRVPGILWMIEKRNTAQICLTA